MNALSRHTFFSNDKFLLLLGVCLGLYFSYHAIAGQRGLLALHSVNAELSTVTAELSDLQTQSEALERRVVMLRPETLDLDYVEELSVQRLGYRQPASITVLGLSTNAAQQ